MPSLRLTKTAVDKLKWSGKQVEYFDTKLTGFGVRVNENSKAYFAQGKVKQSDGTRKKFNVGCGRVDLVDFEDAYVKAEGILRDAAKGLLPEDRRQQDQVESATDQLENMTLRQVYNKYIAEKSKKLAASTKKEYLECLEQNVLDWMERPIRSITPQEVVERHAQIGERSPARADGTFRVVRALCQWVIDTYEEMDIIVSNPCRRLKKKWFRVPRKETYIKSGDLQAWFDAVLLLDELPRMFFLMLLFSGARFTDMAAVKVGKYNFRVGSCVYRVKGNKELDVPVSSWIMPRLEAYIYRNHLQKNDFLFPSIGQKKSKSGHIEDLREQCEKVYQVSGVRFTPHDLRRTFLSYCESLRIPKLVQKRLVGHEIPKDVTDGYIQIPFEDLERAIEEVTAYILKAAKQE